METNGQPFTGVANFKFAIVAPAGNTIWSNDKTSSSGNEPVASTPINVDNGRFSVQNFSFVDDKGDLHENAELAADAIADSFGCNYGCGIFELTRL